MKNYILTIKIVMCIKHADIAMTVIYLFNAMGPDNSS